ncbi:MAG: OadG family transporter subunit [Oscillospiraceae bacterium]|nr:OadG family transporter subunit [Oscillospiraceae bacterium]
MAISDVLITAVVGILVVFIVLVLLMCSIKIMALIFDKMDKHGKNTEASPIDGAVAVSTQPSALGSCGELVLKNVSDRDAAMIMAIVADKLETPINELRFISIKEVEEN